MFLCDWESRTWHDIRRTQWFKSGAYHIKNACSHRVATFLPYCRAVAKTDEFRLSIQDTTHVHCTVYSVHRLHVAHVFALNGLPFVYCSVFVWCRQWCNIHWLYLQRNPFVAFLRHGICCESEYMSSPRMTWFVRTDDVHEQGTRYTNMPYHILTVGCWLLELGRDVGCRYMINW